VSGQSPPVGPAAPSQTFITGVIVATSVLFGANFVALKVGLSYSGPFTLQAWAVLSATIVLIMAGAVRGRPPRLPRDQLRAAAPISVALTVIPSVGIVIGVQRVSAGLAALIVALSPVVTILLLRVTTREPVTRRQVGGMCLGLLGVAVVALSTEERTTAQLVGVLSLLASAWSWAVGLLLTKRLTVGDAPLAFVTWQLGLGVPVLFLLAIVIEGLEVRWGWAYAFAVLWSGALSKGAGSILQYITTGWSSPLHSSLTAFLVPVVAVLLAAIVVDEPIVLAHGAGAALVALGVTAVRRSEPAAPG
jgi:drug/metabolite transporter (DMT)-like permease